MDESIEPLVTEAKRIYEDSLYSAKGHFVAARLWGNVRWLLGIPMTLLSAIAGASALAQFGNHELIAGLLALIVASLAALNTFLNPNENARSHLDSGNRFNSLKNQTRMFYEIEVYSGESIQNLRVRLRELSQKRDELNSQSRQIPNRAYKLAKRGIEDGEALYSVDIERTTSFK